MWGHGAGFGATWPAWWCPRATAPTSPAYGAEQRGWGAWDLFVNSKSSGDELKTKIFFLFLDSNEKLLNTIFAQFFKIYNFCFIHFLI